MRAPAVSEPDYRIGPGDVLNIEVWEVRQGNSLQICVLGRVKTPGRTVLISNIDVLQALASAGGPDQFAKLSRIRIFRREGGKTVIIPFTSPASIPSL